MGDLPPLEISKLVIARHGILSDKFAENCGGCDLLLQKTNSSIRTNGTFHGTCICICTCICIYFYIERDEILYHYVTVSYTIVLEAEFVNTFGYNIRKNIPILLNVGPGPLAGHNC